MPPQQNCVFTAPIPFRANTLQKEGSSRRQPRPQPALDRYFAQRGDVFAGNLLNVTPPDWNAIP